MQAISAVNTLDFNLLLSGLLGASIFITCGSWSLGIALDSFCYLYLCIGTVAFWSTTTTTFALRLVLALRMCIDIGIGIGIGIGIDLIV